MTQTDTKARRAAPQSWLRTHWLQGAMTILLMAVAGLFGAAVGGRVLDPATVTKVEYRNWPVYVQQTPGSCYDAMNAADQAFDQWGRLVNATLKAATLASEGAKEQSPAKLTQASKAIDAAQKINKKDLPPRQKEYLHQAQKCGT